MTDQTEQDPAPRNLPFTVDLRRVHLAVGWIAFGLPLSLVAVAWLPTVCFQDSISHFYFSPVGGDILVGALSFIGLLLLCLYSFDAAGCEGARRWTRLDILLIRLAGIASLLVAFVPTTGTGCARTGAEGARVLLTGAEEPSFDFWAVLLGRTEATGLPLDAVHYGAAGGMFLILAYVVLRVFTRVNSTAAEMAGNRKALRNACYRVLGRMILSVVAVLAVKMAVGRVAPDFLGFWNRFNLTFVFEAAGLFAFGLAWMIKGRFLPIFEDAAARRQARAA
ncbi:hypothetical protein [Roseovarius ramblicola]|uniref:Uncharacterized protein n=1 Tax=Roseovarius ramblicola TaxID=2022336 RepID=A0ABV5I3Y7_9RHOB